MRQLFHVLLAVFLFTVVSTLIPLIEEGSGWLPIVGFALCCMVIGAQIIVLVDDVVNQSFEE